MTRVAIALGSNLGDREARFAGPTAALCGVRRPARHVSSFIETAPVGVDEPQPQYLNAAAAGFTPLGPQPLLDALQSLERAQAAGSVLVRNAARTLDLDLILYGDADSRRARTGGATSAIPRTGAFVLAPLAEIAGDMVDPVTGLVGQRHGGPPSAGPTTPARLLDPKGKRAE